ncbi:methyltransferase domain-containing protein [Luteimonas sp. RD2P54]|uniref:Methyltransferase domain-containing protein n=1 Tax=Luteimonas endophytica TaxID=3042023 RepID=A0ABT6JAG0_9GAMM|nr:methyltransferase domain-containing protein [Luteimonas endophytica]MDH5823809.1 methyltransferase domain-containing protein [Luteimonas endophytica]
MSRCPLCGGVECPPEAIVQGRRYAACGGCGLTFMLPADRPSPTEERAIYDLHRNDPTDPGYRAFLERLAAPLAARLRPGMRGLDYGAGPGAALPAMLSARGLPTSAWDPLYAADERLLRRRYHFIACSETAEHFHDPAAEFARLGDLLLDGGWLGLMTQWRLPGRPFASWGYARDPTHVCFYRRRTLRWIAGRHGWSLECPAPHIALFRKPPAALSPCG